MANEKYSELSNKIIDLLGSKGNIAGFTHCITRLRFNVKDKSIVNVDDIKSIKGVVGCKWQGEQLQIIIGQDVGDAYDLICKEHDLEMKEGINENLDEETNQKKKRFDIRKSLLVIVDCLAPIFPLLIGSSLIKCVCILLSTTGVVSETSMTYQFFFGAASAGMYYLPIYLGATSAKRFGANQGLGMLMGAMLLFPDIQAMINSGEALNMFGIPVTTDFVYYGSSIIPAILMVWVMSRFEKFFKRILPNAIKSMLTPFLTIAIMIPLGFIVLGPAAAIVGAWFSSLITGFYDTFGLFAVGIFSAAFPWIISTGMHSAVLPPYYMWALSTMGYDPITKVGAFIMNINAGVAGLALSLKLKNKDTKSLAISSSITSIVGGISEPVLFGFNLKYMKPMYACTIGGLVAGLIAGAMQVKGYPGQNSLLGMVTFGLGGSSNLIWMVVATIAGALVTFICTLVLCRKGDLDE